MKVRIEPMTPAHWPRVREIYRSGLETGQASFETRVPSWEEWHLRHRPDCRLVAVCSEEQVVGWAALTPVSTRPVYWGVAEVSLYVDPARWRQGIGHTLMARLVTDSERSGTWTLQASIFPENLASFGLHRRHGFRVVGTRRHLALHHGVWRDVLLLERRSPTVGY